IPFLRPSPTACPQSAHRTLSSSPRPLVYKTEACVGSSVGPTRGLIASSLQQQARLRLDLAFFCWRVHVRDFLASVAPFAGFFGEIRLVEIIFEQADVFAFEFARDVFERRRVDGVPLRVFAGHRV